LPEHLADYLVVHELCHLKERNHGKNFWALVASAVPQYVSYRKDLQNFEISFKPSVDVI
jgi:predicted metal-dependent hydrolase